jgi:uncharacterized protein YkwD
MSLNRLSLQRFALLCAVSVMSLGGTGCAELLARGAAASQAPQVAVELTQEENQVLAATNAFRKDNGLSELKTDGRLVVIARQRSADMATRSYFSHQTPEGEDVFGIMREARYPFWAAGENLARNNFPADLAMGEAMSGWRKSPEHRANLLHPAFGHVGVGVASAADGKRYVTQVFTD